MPDTYTLAEAALKVIQDRRSIREFTPEDVSEQDLDMILEFGPPGALRRERPTLAVHHCARP